METPLLQRNPHNRSDLLPEKKLAAAVILTWVEDIKRAAAIRSKAWFNHLKDWPYTEIGRFWSWAVDFQPTTLVKWAERTWEEAIARKEPGGAKRAIPIQTSTRNKRAIEVERAKTGKKTLPGKRAVSFETPKNGERVILSKNSGSKERAFDLEVPGVGERADLGKKTLRSERASLGREPGKKERVTTLENPGIRKRAIQPENSLNPKRAKDGAMLCKKTRKSERALAGKRAAFSKKTGKEERAMPYQISKTEERTWQTRWAEVEARLRQMLGEMA